MGVYCNASLALLLWLVHTCLVCKASSLSNFTDEQSLIAFKSAIKIDPDSILAKNWTTYTQFCNWHGVWCSKRRQRVTGLHLPSMGLVGPISPHIGNLSFLKVLYLYNNSFHGQVIRELGYLSRLRILVLSTNKLTGEIPVSLHQCQKLQTLALAYNELIGMIPKTLSTLPWLDTLLLGGNNLTGKIPPSFGNISTLQTLGLERNQIHGNIPNEIALLPRLRAINLGLNSFTGSIPPLLFNVSSLEHIELPFNSFTGDLPKEMGLQLPNLVTLYLGGNQLAGNIPSYLSNASSLTSADLRNNNFTGTLPATLPISLQFFTAGYCQLQGKIPKGIGSLKNLIYLGIQRNKLSGTIPSTIGGLEKLQQLYLHNNELEGSIPEEICLLSNLGKVYLPNNRISGSIPRCMGNLRNLQWLYLDNNALSSTIPSSLWNLENLLGLTLSSNSLHGNLSQIIKASTTIEYIDLSRNQISGHIPDTLGAFQSLVELDLSQNLFSGPIPESFGKLKGLDSLNLANNNLSGSIPKSLEALSYLKYLNLSYNNLTGEIPSGGPFANFTAQSFTENRELCGLSISKPCPSHSSRKTRNKLFPLTYIAPIIITVMVIGILFYLIFRKHSGNNLRQPSGNILQEYKIISYQELSHATSGFCEANFLGAGSFGHVYKGILSDGEIVAVKLLNLSLHGAMKSFDAECKVLRTVRHKNLVKVISTCTNPELRALILEYMPNGSLEKWLYSHNYCLDFLQRVRIMLDVALALEYLHCGQPEPVIHCDLKPSNVLLDEDMVARVSDFGIAKILAANKTATHTHTLGTFGYIAPEYGTEGRVSTQGDVYSYGIMLLETFTRKKPTDEMFSGDLSLRQWVSASVPNMVFEVVDDNLFNINQEKGRSAIPMQRNLLAILDLGLGCSSDLPEERFEIKDVVSQLNKIKLRILSE